MARVGDRAIGGIWRYLIGQRVLLVACSVILVNQLGFGIITPVTPLYAQTFGVDDAAIGLVVSVYGLARFLFNAPFGQFADRFGRREVIVAGALLTCLGNVLCGLAGSFPELLAFRFVAGAGSAAVITGTQIVVADVAVRENRGRMMSIYSAFFQCAVSIGPTVGGIIDVLLGPRAPFFTFGALTLVAGFIALTRLPDTRAIGAPATSAPATRESSGAQSLGKAGVSSVPATRGPSVTRLLLFNVGFLTASSIALVAAFNRTGAMFNVVPLMGVERLGVNAAAIGVALTAGNLCNLAVVGLVGVLVDRYGRKAVIVPSGLFSGLAFVGFAFTTGYPLFLLSAVLWGIGAGASNTASSAYAADQAPPGANGITMGMYRMISDAGYVVGPTLLGLVAASGGASSALLIAAGLAALVVVPFLLFAPETGGKRRHLAL